MLDFRNCSDKSKYHDDWQKLAAHKMNKIAKIANIAKIAVEIAKFVRLKSKGCELKCCCNNNS